MAVSKLICPECSAVLRPAKPLPAGKPVKCPECGHRFAAPDAEAPAAPPKKPKKAAEGAAAAGGGPKKGAELKKGSPKKPAAPKAGPPEKKPAAKKDDDEDEGGIYGYVKEEEKEEEDKPDIEYAPDMSTRDLRGPAQVAVNRPSNQLILLGVLGFFGWVGMFIVFLIPAVFPVPDTTGTESSSIPVAAIEYGLTPTFEKGTGGMSGGAANLPEAVKPPAKDPFPPFNFFILFGVDWSVLMNGPLWLVFVKLSPCWLGAAYSAVVAFGAVKMQSLESRGWGVAAAILAIIPLNTGGLMVVSGLLCRIILKQLVGMVAADPHDIVLWQGVGYALYWTLAVFVLEFLGGAAIGAYALVVLNREEVVKGFEYKPD